MKSLKKKESLRANHDYWQQQIAWSKAKKEQDKLLEESGGTQAAFLKKIFKN